MLKKTKLNLLKAFPKKCGAVFGLETLQTKESSAAFRFNKNGNSASSSFLAFGLLIGSVFLAPNDVNAQDGCTQIPTCPIAPPIDVTQNQGGDLAASIYITGNVITYNLPDYDPQNPPATISATDISSTASGIGNVVSAKAVDGTKLIYNSNQTITGNVNVYNEIVTLASVPGIIAQIATANGNSAQAETCCGDLDFFANQNASVGEINAQAVTITSPGLGALTSNTSANANIVAIDGNFALANVVSNQNNQSKVSSITFTDACCSDGTLAQNALAVGNATNMNSASSTAYGWITQTNLGEISSSSESKVNSGTNISTTAQSVGNSSLVYNKWGYTQGSIYQYSNGDINSYAKAAPLYFTNSTTVGAAAQGNSAVLSTIGSDGLLIAHQEIGNIGTVSATAEFLGFSNGGVGNVAASASGNALVGFACSACTRPGIQMTGDTTQINGANTNATVNFDSGGSSYSNSYGVAAGNSATFIAQQGKSIK